MFHLIFAGNVRRNLCAGPAELPNKFEKKVKSYKKLKKKLQIFVFKKIYTQIFSYFPKKLKFFRKNFKLKKKNYKKMDNLMNV